MHIINGEIQGKSPSLERELWGAYELWCEKKLECEEIVVFWQGNEVGFMVCDKKNLCVYVITFFICV